MVERSFIVDDAAVPQVPEKYHCSEVPFVIPCDPGQPQKKLSGACPLDPKAGITHHPQTKPEQSNRFGPALPFYRVPPDSAESPAAVC